MCAYRFYKYKEIHFILIHVVYIHICTHLADIFNVLYFLIFLYLYYANIIAFTYFIYLYFVEVILYYNML